MSMSVGGGAEGEPMMDINTTPLIDVMLCLLIIFIMNIPLQTHAVKLDLPTGNPPPIVNTVKNKITMDPTGQTFWNGQQVPLPQIRNYLDQTMQLPDPPELQIQPDPEAPYQYIDQLMAIVKDANVTKVGFVGNQNYANVF